MSQFDAVLSSLKNESYTSKKQLLEYMLRMIQSVQRSPQKLDEADKTAILQYAFSEVDPFLAAIQSAGSYKEKDLIFDCEDLLLGLIMQLCPDSEQIPQDDLASIKLLVALVEKERYLETAVDKLFAREQIEEKDVAALLALAAQTPDEYQRGKLYAGIAHYAQSVTKFTETAKSLVSRYLAAEFTRYLGMESRSTDCVNNLELASDVCRHFATGEISALLYKVMKLGYGNVNYYAVDTLLYLGENIPEEIVSALAENLEYANLTYGALMRAGKQTLFPKEYSTAEYLAKSDMVRWLTYPTELGKQPDEIEYIGKITYLFRKEVYYVFRFRSDSDTLDEHLKNKWLIGWSSEEGGTFSNFDEYALFEKATTSATLKNIKKKLIG